MALVDQEYPINEAAVEAISAQVQAYLTRLNKERRDLPPDPPEPNVF